MTGKETVCAEILEIMETYHEQDKSPYGVDTPGGLEHMGDVWRLFEKWEQLLHADKLIAAPNSPVIPDSSRPPWSAPWPDVLNQIHWLATRALAEPRGDTATLMAICTLLESDAPAVADTRDPEKEKQK